MRDKIEIFKAISEPSRVRILMMLLQKPLCVCEITSILKLSTPTVSNHLAYLREKGFIVDEKEGKWINYRIVKNSTDMIVKHIVDSLPIWFSAEQTVIDDLAEVNKVDRYVICGIDLGNL